MYLHCLTGPSTVYWIKNRCCVAVSSPLSGSAAVASKNHVRDLGLRVINPAVRMRHNETKPPDPAVRPPLVGSRWCMALVGEAEKRRHGNVRTC